MSFLERMYTGKLRRIAEKVKNKQADFKDFTQEDYINKTNELKARVQAGAKLDEVMIEAYALVSSAGCKVMKYDNYYDSQLMGGIALNDGNVAELATGEGKTLMSTLPAFLNALSGEPVHIITANEYLAQRDAEEMGQIFSYLGLKVGCILSNQDKKAKKEAYQADITYGTSSEFGFDYLRDNMCVRPEDKVARGYGFALIDEVDSVLIDDAKTPLIIADKEDFDIQNYKDAAKFVNDYITDNDVDIDLNYGTVIFNSRGNEKIEMMYGIDNLFDLDDEHSQLLYCLINAIKAKFMMKKNKDYIIQDNKIVLIDTQKGRPMPTHRFANGLHSAIEAKENLTNPNVMINGEQTTRAQTTYQRFFSHYNSIAGMSGTVMTSSYEFQSIYNLYCVKIDSHKEPQRVDEEDIFTITKEEKFNLICEDIKRCYDKRQPVLIGTATIAESKEIAERLEKMGIPHQLLNAKNQKKEAAIIAQAGRAGAVTIATNMAGRGTDIKLGGNPEWLTKKDLIDKYNIDEDKANAVIIQIENIPNIEMVQDESAREVIKFYNERLAYHKAEAKKEKAEVLELGGLRVIGAERQESRRVDDQLKGRSGRQGDPGSSVFYVSMDDDLIVNNLNEKKRKVLYDMIENGLDRNKFSKLVNLIQDENEGTDFGARKNTFLFSGIYDNQMQHFHQERDKILTEPNMKDFVIDLIYGKLNQLLTKYMDREITKEECNKEIQNYFLADNSNFFIENLKTLSIEELRDKIMDKIVNTFDKATDYAKAIGGKKDINQTLREKMLDIMDENWAFHIDYMEEIKKTINFEQNPVYAYNQRTREGYDVMMENIVEESIKDITKLCRDKARTFENVFGTRGIREPKPLYSPMNSRNA